MNITRDEARRIAQLAHLAFDDAGLDTMAAEMTEILGYIDQLRAVDADRRGTAEARALVMAEDVPHQSVDRAVVEANAPAVRDGFFVVPRIVGAEE